MGPVPEIGSLRVKVWPYLSYDGDLGPGFRGSMPAQQPTLSRALEVSKIAYRPTGAILRDNPDLQDYPYDTEWNICEKSSDLDLVMHSEL